MGIYSINESASAALRIAQAGILVTSQNVAGTSIEGFSRRSASTVMDALAPNSLMLNGSSFAVEGFTREYSSLIGGQLLNQQAKSSNSETLVQYVSTIDSVIANQSAGLSSAITDFFNTMGKYAANPTNKSLAAAITGSANVVAQRMTGITNLVSQLRSDSSTGLNDTVKQINIYTPALAAINQQIIEANSPGNSSPSADLLDERDRILANLQKLIGGQSLINRDGTATQFIDGLPLVERGLANTISINGDGNSLAINFKQLNGNINTTQTIKRVDGGQAGALLTLKNEFIPKIEQRLNTAAIALVKVSNESIVDTSASPLAIFGFKVNSNTFSNFGDTRLPITVPQFNLGSEIDLKNLYDSLGSISQTETATATFKAMNAGQTLTVAGLTFTAGSSGATATQVASAFANVTNGMTNIELNSSKNLGTSAGGTFSAGSINGWNSGSPSGAFVSFTSTTSNLNLANLSASGSTGIDLPTISTWKEGYSGNSVFLANKLTAENFISIAPNDPLMYYNSGDVLNPKISSINANAAQLKSAHLGNVVADLVTDVGVQVATWKNSQKVNDTVLDNLKEQRDQLSGVNLDEEAANLLKYQQLYSASTKILQTGNQMFNTLLAIMN
ncbi:flagellar basal body rod C-terminal domain-containing protein [Polynucleobacter sp. UK-FUSCHL-C3]|uniref:Flagellar hook-associated protein 1 n=1 Tax=Polynucleobacter sp. UK-FUSCHL-C3 TaxID=2955208 RepID=A0AAU8A0Z0_9BURK